MFVYVIRNSLIVIPDYMSLLLLLIISSFPLQYDPNLYSLGLFSQQELTRMDIPLFEEGEPEVSCFVVRVQSYSSLCGFIYISSAEG